GDAGQQVGGAGAARDQAHPEPAGDPGQAVGHEGGALLVAHVDVLDRLVVVEDVEHVEEGRADDPEDVADTLGLQDLDDRAARAHLGHVRDLPPTRWGDGLRPWAPLPHRWTAFGLWPGGRGEPDAPAVARRQPIAIA